MGKMNRRPDLSRLNKGPKGNLLGTKEALAEKNKIDTLSEYQIEYIPVSKLEPMSYNAEMYSLDDFDFLGATIKQYGILQPLIVQKQPNVDKYWIVAGERRYQSYLLAMKDESASKLYAKGLPCRVYPETMSIVEIKMLVILTNATARARDQETQFKELKELVSLFEQAEKDGTEIGYSLKDLAMSKLQISERQYQKYLSAMNMIPALAKKAEEENADLNLSAAIGAKPVEVQEEILERVEDGEDISEAYTNVNTQYKEYKKEGKEIENEISNLKSRITEMESDDSSNEEEILELKQEIKEKKKQKKEHKENLREAVKKPKNEKTNSVRLEEKQATVSADALNPFSINVSDAMTYIEKSARALFVHANDLSQDGIDKLKELRDQIDMTIKRAESSGEEFIV